MAEVTVEEGAVAVAAGICCCCCCPVMAACMATSWAGVSATSPGRFVTYDGSCSVAEAPAEVGAVAVGAIGAGGVVVVVEVVVVVVQVCPAVVETEEEGFVCPCPFWLLLAFLFSLLEGVANWFAEGEGVKFPHCLFPPLVAG